MTASSTTYLQQILKIKEHATKQMKELYQKLNNNQNKVKSITVTDKEIVEVYSITCDK